MLETADKYLRSDAWPVGTELLLLNVPWDEGYRDVVAWESAEARDAWFDAQTSEVYRSNRFNYLWPNQPIAVPVPYSSAYRYNYVAVTNPAQPVDDEGPVRTYYYFITSVDYLSPQASNLTVQLDVMTTYGPTVELGRAFVERGHIAMANSKLTRATRYDYLTMPEGLDVGASYVATHKEYVNLMGDSSDGAYVIIVSSASLTADPGNVTEPNLETARGSSFDSFPNGCEVYAIEANRLQLFMQELSHRSWVAQCVIDLYLVPGALVDINDTSVNLFGGDFKLYNSVQSASAWLLQSQHVADVRISDSDMTPFVEEDTPEKMFCYPYTVVELTSFDGNPVMLKPESMPETMAMESFGTASPPHPRFYVFPQQYEAQYLLGGTSFDSRDVLGHEITVSLPLGSGLDNAVVLQNFPHVTIVNNNYQLYLASNANRLSYQYQSAGWQLDRANMQANVAYENQQQMAGLGLEQSNRMNQAYMENVDRSLVSGAVTGGAQGLVGLSTGSVHGVLGGITNVVNSAVEAQNNANLQSAQLANAWGTYGARSAVNDRNLSLAETVNRGDYQNRVAGINATVQDAALTAPSTIGQMAGEVLNWRNCLVGVMVTVKTITGASRRAVIDYFRRYGYAIHRWMEMGTVRRLLCMRHFAYWKVLETTVTAVYANESERQTIRGVFEKGVTLWDAPESIGTTDLSDNAPRSGYSY